MSMLELACGAILILEFIFPLMIWQGADFRPLESPEITHRLSDVAWLMFVGVVSTGIVQAVAIAVPILRDRRADPIIPRWVAYTNLWCAVIVGAG
jgi:hypothetical protein